MNNKEKIRAIHCSEIKTGNSCAFKTSNSCEFKILTKQELEKTHTKNKKGEKNDKRTTKTIRK